MSRRITPQGSNVLIQELSKEEVLKSGIVLPPVDEGRRRDYTYGLVLEVGDGYDTASMHQADVTAHLKRVQADMPWKLTIPKQLEPGERVAVNSYGIERIKLMGRELFLVGKVHIAAKVEEIECRICDGSETLDSVIDGAITATEVAAIHDQLCTICWGAYLMRIRNAKPQEARSG